MQDAQNTLTYTAGKNITRALLSETITGQIKRTVVCEHLMKLVILEGADQFDSPRQGLVAGLLLRVENHLPHIPGAIKAVVALLRLQRQRESDLRGRLRALEVSEELIKKQLQETNAASLQQVLIKAVQQHCLIHHAILLDAAVVASKLTSISVLL